MVYTGFFVVGNGVSDADGWMHSGRWTHDNVDRVVDTARVEQRHANGQAKNP